MTNVTTRNHILDEFVKIFVIHLTVQNVYFYFYIIFKFNTTLICLNQSHFIFLD